MYAINKLYGIGEVTSESETKVTVKFEECEKSLLKLATLKMYATYEEAEAALDEIEEPSAHLFNLGDNSASNWLAEKNRENAFKNRPSSMR